jgi:hypothetical protein
VQRAVLSLLGLLGRLQLRPVRQHRVGVLRDDVPKHVRVAANQLGDDAARDVVDAELPSVKRSSDWKTICSSRSPSSSRWSSTSPAASASTTS